jgi:hypothetical protein
VPDPGLATVKDFSRAGPKAVKFLHLERRILFHGHELLDTTPNHEGEDWLMHNGYTQVDGSGQP